MLLAIHRDPYCLLIDPKVDVIYVSPVELTDDVYQYYSKLLAMKAGGDVKDEAIENRYKIVVPDAVHRFPVSKLKRFYSMGVCSCFKTGNIHTDILVLFSYSFNFSYRTTICVLPQF